MSHLTAKLAQTAPDEIGLADDRTQLTWPMLHDQLNRAANALIGMEFGPEDRVAVFARNSVEAILGYQGALHAGLSSVPVNSHFTVDELAYILENSGSKVVFVDAYTAQTALDAAKISGGATVIGWRCESIEGVKSWEEMLAAAGPEQPSGDIKPMPLLHYTSGTTGRPKGARTPPALFPRTDTIREFFDTLSQGVGGIPPQTPAMIVSPLYHTGPLITMRLLGAGTAIVILPKFDAEKVIAEIERHKIKGVMMVPAHFQRLLALPQSIRDKYDISSIQQISHTGSACPRDTKHRMIDWFGPVLMEAYGATESGTTNVITSEEWLRKPGSVGKTLPMFEVVVVSEDKEKLGPNEVGELYFRDVTGRGIVYHNDPEKTAAVHLEPGVFTLGEMGYVDDDGYVFITDRVTDMIVSGGVNIYPIETEDILSGHPDVADVAVVGVPNTELGEEPKALVIPSNPASPPATEVLDAYCREHLAGFKCPKSYEFVDDIGRNAMGKLNKRALRKKYWPTDRTIGG